MNNEDSIQESETGKYNKIFQAKIPANIQEYHILYHRSIEQREKYWGVQAKRLKWDKDFTTTVREDFSTADIAWFIDGKLNGCKNALDVHIEDGRGSEKALVYYTPDGHLKSYSYNELQIEVQRIAAALESEGYKAGDRIAIYMPDCPETVFFMLACACLGIIYVPIPCHFNAEITSEIIHDSGASLLIISQSLEKQSYRERSLRVAQKIGEIKIIIISGEAPGKMLTYPEFLNRSPEKPEKSYMSVEAEHPLFIIYANSAAGIPRGSVFATGGFLVQAATSFDSIFQSEKNAVNAESIVCTLNLVSAAGQSYGLWGPLLNGSCIVFSADGEETTADTLRELLNESDSPVLLTTPRMLTALKRKLNDASLSEKKRFLLVACCEDVLTPRLVSFAGKALASGAEKVLNMWLQSESGTALINTYQDIELNRPGALGVPFFGTKPLAMNNMGQLCRTNESGQLVFAFSWPGMLRTVWGQPERFRELYFQRLPGYFMTNDGVRIDSEGFFWFMGRLDDVIKIRGQSLATSEIEAVLVTHPEISEAAVVSAAGKDSDNLIAFLIVETKMIDSKDKSELNTLESELSDNIVRRIGEFALPDHYVFAGDLPRTRTGKLVRRILRRIASGGISPEEDLSHVANPESVEKLIEGQ